MPTRHCVVFKVTSFKDLWNRIFWYSTRYRKCYTRENRYYSQFSLTTVKLYFMSLWRMRLQVDILDTCGNPQFPAMRRLSIANANAFLFVYSIDCERSFETVKRNFEEVREQREDYQVLPIVVAGNKLDLPADHRRVTVEDASEWLYCELPKMRWVYNFIILEHEHGFNNIIDMVYNIISNLMMWSEKKYCVS